MKKHASKIYLFLVIGILYIPIITLIFFSFNDSESTAKFTGFSLKWYIELFNENTRGETFTALKNSLILALSSAALSTVIGTAAAEGIHRMRSKHIRRTVETVTKIPMMNPDIVTGMSMMLFFVAVAGVVGLNYDSIGFITMLIAHTTFCLPYVILSVLPVINDFGNSMTEAAQDLGCTPFGSFFRVKLPNITSGIISGFIMAFTLSLDDFVISYFVGSAEFQTLPLLIYSMTKKRVTPDMYALSTLIIAAVFILLFISNVRSGRHASGRHKKAKAVTE